MSSFNKNAMLNFVMLGLTFVHEINVDQANSFWSNFAHFV